MDRKTAAGKEISLKTVKEYDQKVLSRVPTAPTWTEFIPKNYAMDLKGLDGITCAVPGRPLSTDEEQRFCRPFAPIQIGMVPFFSFSFEQDFASGSLGAAVEDILFEERQILVDAYGQQAACKTTPNPIKERRVDMSQN